MDVKWEFSYYPIGGWIDPEGNSVRLSMPFRAKHRDTVLLVTPKGIHSAAGHGEPAMDGTEPQYFINDTLEPFELPQGDFITTEGSSSEI